MSDNQSTVTSLTKEWVLNLAQAQATYDITLATGDVYIEKYYLKVSTVGATFTSVAIQTDDTTPYSLLTAIEGAVANLVAGANLNPANKVLGFKLTSGQKLQFTIVGATGTGALKLGIIYRQMTGGASLS